MRTSPGTKVRITSATAKAANLPSMNWSSARRHTGFNTTLIIRSAPGSESHVRPRWPRPAVWARARMTAPCCTFDRLSNSAAVLLVLSSVSNAKTGCPMAMFLCFGHAPQRRGILRTFERTKIIG